MSRFAERLCSAAMGLPRSITKDVLPKRFEGELPQNLQDQATLMSGYFESVGGAVSLLSTLQRASPTTVREDVREISEDTRHGDGSKDRARDESKQRCTHLRCHFCQHLGHIARYSAKRKAIKVKKTGKDQGGRNLF